MILDHDYRLPPDIEMESVTTPQSELVDWSHRFIGLPDLWQRYAGDGVKVAILDTGIDSGHQDLQGQILDAKDFTRSIYGVEDRHAHGTWCAGFIAANANSIGVRGAAPKSKLLVAKVLGDNGSGSDAAIAAGMRWADSKDADIFSLSLGGPRMSDNLHRVFMEISSKPNKFIIAATGNDGGRVNFPGAWPETIGVGACDNQGRITRFTSRGPELDVIAPGVDMISTAPGNRYVKMTGTSMATPCVAAVVALMLSKHRKKKSNSPLETVSQLREHLKRTAKQSGGYYLIDPAKLLATNGDTVPAPPSNEYGPFEFDLGPVHLRIYASVK